MNGTTDNPSDDCDPRHADEVCPNYTLYDSISGRESKISHLACAFVFLTGLDFLRLTIILTISGLTVIGVALASPCRELTSNGAIGACVVAVVLSVVCLTVFFKGIKHAKAPQREADQPPHS
jgi:hypothetical protein